MQIIKWPKICKHDWKIKKRISYSEVTDLYYDEKYNGMRLDTKCVGMGYVSVDFGYFMYFVMKVKGDDELIDLECDKCGEIKDNTFRFIESYKNYMETNYKAYLIDKKRKDEGFISCGRFRNPFSYPRDTIWIIPDHI